MMLASRLQRVVVPAARGVITRGFAAEKLNKVVFTAVATNTGGGRANAKVVSHGDNAFLPELAVEKHPNQGGTGEGTNPEELFAAGYASCFNGALQFVAGNNKIECGASETTAHVSFGPTDSGVGIAVRLDVAIEGVDDATAKKLGELTHDFCPYSKATRGNIEVEINASPK